MDSHYLAEVHRHTLECVEDLNELAEILGRSSLTRRDHRAAERALQVLVEACIGVAKRWVKDLDKNVPIDAYKSFQRLAQLQVIPAASMGTWRRIIGLRNALVHDYLNIDPDIIESILRNRYYLELYEFIDAAVGQDPG